MDPIRPLYTEAQAIVSVTQTTRLLASMQRRGGERTRAKLAGRAVLIWSNEHRAYWRPNRAGYTTVPETAGVYAFEDAYAATWHCGPEKQIEFRVVSFILAPPRTCDA